jgi:hypothetical protein
MRQLVSVLLIAAAAFVLLSRVTTRANDAPPTAADKKQVRAGRVKFGIGLVLLGGALVLHLMDVKDIVVAACYVLGAGFLAQGYMQEFSARRRSRFGGRKR